MNTPTLANVKETTAPSPALTAWRCRRFCSIRLAAALAFSLSLISSNVSMVVVGETVGGLVWRGHGVGVEEGAILPSVVATVGTAVCRGSDGIKEGDPDGSSVGRLLGDEHGLAKEENAGLLDGLDDGLAE